MEGTGTIARVYAGALLELAKEGNAAEERYAEVRALRRALDEEPRLTALLDSPRVKQGRKREIVEEVLGDDVSPDLRKLVLLMIEKNRQMFLGRVLAAFGEMWDEEHGRIRGTLTTARPVEDEAVSRIAAGFSERIGRELVLERRVDPEILGGAVLRYGEYRVDGSLRRRIRRLRGELLRGTEGRES